MKKSKNTIRVKLAQLLLSHYLGCDVYPHVFLLGRKEEGDLLEDYKENNNLKILNNEYFSYILEGIPVLIVNKEEFLAAASFDNLKL